MLLSADCLGPREVLSTPSHTRSPLLWTLLEHVRHGMQTMMSCPARPAGLLSVMTGCSRPCRRMQTVIDWSSEWPAT